MLKFIGNGSAFNVERGNNSAYYIEGNQMLLIDCGSNIFERIIKANLLEGIEHIHVLVTHTHADHVGSLADLILFTYYSHGEFAKPKVTIHSYNRLGVSSLLKSMGIVIDKHCYYKQNYRLFNLYNVFNNISFSIFDTEHVEELRSTGFEIVINTSHIYYSGDTTSITYNVDLNAINNQEYDYAFIDTCKADYDGNVHLSLRKLSELIKPEARNRIWCMHLDNGFDVQEAKQLGFNVTKNIFE